VSAAEARPGRSGTVIGTTTDPSSFDSLIKVWVGVREARHSTSDGRASMLVPRECSRAPVIRLEETRP